MPLGGFGAGRPNRWRCSRGSTRCLPKFSTRPSRATRTALGLGFRATPNWCTSRLATPRLSRRIAISLARPFDRHPGISVVDIDADGYDDLYIAVRRGRNMLLHNGGDGTFRRARGPIRP